MKSIATVLICSIAIAMCIGTVSAITPITLDVNLQEDGANIDTSKTVTINYNTEDAATPPNPLPVSINTEDDLDPDEGPIYAWGLYDSNNNPCTSGPDCKAKLYAGIGIYSKGTDIVIQVEGYEDYTFSSVTSNVGPVDVDLTPSGDELSVNVFYPNGGESIPVGTQVQVSAHATDDNAVTSVTFYYTNGSNWNLIGAGTRVSGTAKDGIWNKTWNTNGLNAGTNYLIKANASDGILTREDQSDSTFSLTTCTPPSTPTLNDPGATDTDGNYTVSWSSVSGATNYTLEEDTSSSFSSPTVVYSGASTSKYITGKSNGTYYYRVKACNACGCSGWSNVEDIVVEIPDGNIITVDDSGGADYTKIQDAIANASSGYTIKVFSGTYNEHVATNKSLKLIGEDKETTIIDGGGSGQCIYVVADNVKISGFTIQNGADGVYVAYSNGCTIANNIISDNYDGIYLSNSNNITIAHNSLSNNIVYFSGIHLSSSSNNLIHDNDLSGNGGGITLSTSHNNIICHNNLINNGNQAYDNTGTNLWDNSYPSGGNYWGDYMGSDAYNGPNQNVSGSDGIGDTVYGINGGVGAQDRYPFMQANGWIDTSTVFDTGSGTYPSIFGTHNGAIKPKQTITVSKLYTYPCAGTGGHTEYARVWNNSGLDRIATWSGYKDDWHNITFDDPFTLFAEKTYYYEIRTGSYPQIIHKPEHTTLNGSFINCTSFVDANGKEYYDWIPAIRLFLQ